MAIHSKKALLSLTLLFTIVSSLAMIKDGELRLRANLSAPASAGDISGKADFRQRDDGGRRQFSVEVEGLTPGNMFDVMVAGVIVGTVTINGFGVGDINFDDNFEPGEDDPATRFPANFPALNGGELVQVGVLSGTFQLNGQEGDNGNGNGNGNGNNNGNSNGNNNGNGNLKIKFKGTIESMPSSGLIGNWVIGGRFVRVTPSTRINQHHGAASVGVLVKVKGRDIGGGSVEAIKIQVKDSN